VTNRAKRRGYTHVLQADFLEWKTDMKFDVVIGNPPYQDANNDKKMLWNSFTDIAVKYTKANGIISLITPTSWLRAKSNIHNSYSLFEDYQVEKAVIYAKDNTPFPGVGSTISYHITHKRPKSGPTCVYYNEWSTGEQTFVGNIDLLEEKIWPSDMSNIALSVHNKLKKFDKIIFEKSCEFHNQKLKQKGLVNDSKSDVYKFTHHVSAAITRFTSVKFSKHSAWKVMVPVTSTIDKAVVDNECGHGEDMFTVYCSNQTSALNIANVLRSDAYKFIGRFYKSGRNQILQGVFPVVDFNKQWTTNELFDLFGFTDEEKEYARLFR
jgi:hypothetical protein